jgi:hypothetical protein
MRAPTTDLEADRLARKLARRLRLVNVLWIVISLLQLSTVIGAVIAAWNLYVIARRWHLPRLVVSRSPAAVAAFRGNEGWYLTFFLINLLGGVVGAGLVAYEFLLIRGPLLGNGHLFMRGAAT